jgi:hypothetical protein
MERIKLSKSTVDLKDCKILATFLKDTDNIGIITELRTRNFTIINNQLKFFWGFKEYSD